MIQPMIWSDLLQVLAQALLASLILAVSIAFLIRGLVGTILSAFNDFFDKKARLQAVSNLWLHDQYRVRERMDGEAEEEETVTEPESAEPNEDEEVELRRRARGEE